MLKNEYISGISRSVFQGMWLILTCVALVQKSRLQFSTHLWEEWRIRSTSMALCRKHHILLIAGLYESLRVLSRSIWLSHSQSGGHWPRQHLSFDLHIKYAYRQAENRLSFHPSGHISRVSFSAIHDHHAKENVSVCVHSSRYRGANRW